METKLTKPGLRAPCRFTTWSQAKKKEVDRYPDVNCCFECDACGWNPEVKKERLERMFHGD